MRLLFTSFPAVGHFHPMAPLAHAAADAGHEVVVAIGPNLQPWVEACGLRAVACGLSLVEAVERAEQAGDDAATGTALLFTRVSPESLMVDLEELVAGWRPDLIVHEESEFAGPLCAARAGIACVTHSWTAPVKTEEVRAQVLRFVQALWDAYGGLPARMHGELYLDACPPPFQMPAIASIPNVQPLRAVLYDGPPQAAGLALEELPSPLAYATLGTVEVFSRAQVLRDMATAIAPLVASLVVTTGPNAPDALGELPPNVHVLPYLPQSQLLPHLDLVVSHGGAGTTFGALLAGVPHLVLPQGAPSQGLNAGRVEELGIGLALPDAADADALRAAALRLLREPGFAAAARRLRGEMDALPSPASVVELLEARVGAAAS